MSIIFLSIEMFVEWSGGDKVTSHSRFQVSDCRRDRQCFGGRCGRISGRWSGSDPAQAHPRTYPAPAPAIHPRERI